MNKGVNLIQLALQSTISLQEFAPSLEKKQKEGFLLLLVSPRSFFVVSIIDFLFSSSELRKIGHIVGGRQGKQLLYILQLLVRTSEVPPLRVEIVKLLLL